MTALRTCIFSFRLGKFGTDDPAANSDKKILLSSARARSARFRGRAIRRAAESHHRDTAGLHVGSIMPERCGWGRRGRTVGVDEERQVGAYASSRIAPDADHPFVMLDVEFAVALPDFLDVEMLPCMRGSRSWRIWSGMSG